VLALADMQRGARPVPQTEGGATMRARSARRKPKSTGPAVRGLERDSALRPTGRAHATAGEPIKVWRAGARPARNSGTVLEAGAGGVKIACGGDALMVTELQRAGATRLGAADFLRGFPIPAGARFGTAR
jgi:methionyl-tRNA formyltransferase